MECAAKGSVSSRCSARQPSRACPRCDAVVYCSVSHQISHWSSHRGECSRLRQQVQRAKALNDLPFTFCEDFMYLVSNGPLTKCNLLIAKGVHQKGIWKSECECVSSAPSSDNLLINDKWHLPSSLCPCLEPKHPLTSNLRGWNGYYQWRCLPLSSPVALLLHWPLTVYHCFQLVSSSITLPDIGGKLCIHYLGPDRELLQLATFGELCALFPSVNLHITLVGPEVPDAKDNENITLSTYINCSEEACKCRSSSITGSISLHLRKGLYHDIYNEINEESSPHVIIAPNAGLAAYSSWIPTIVKFLLSCRKHRIFSKELIRRIRIPAVFSDFCEEAANMAACCIEKVTGEALRMPVQVNPFRQPMPVADSVLRIPCYSNCFLLGM